MAYKGVIIEESLEDKSVLGSIKIINTKIERVTEEFKTPWLTHWTLHAVEIPEKDIEKVAVRMGTAIDKSHSNAWYVDLKNSVFHYIIFRTKLFKIERISKKQYERVVSYGMSLGIPKHQLDFSPTIK